MAEQPEPPMGTIRMNLKNLKFGNLVKGQQAVLKDMDFQGEVIWEKEVGQRKIKAPKVDQSGSNREQVPDESTALSIARKFFKDKINSKGPEGDPKIIRWNENWKIAWSSIWIMVNAKTGAAYQADSGSD